MPRQFGGIVYYERAFGWTIRRSESVLEVSEGGRAYDAALRQPAPVELALSSHYTEDVAIQYWNLPPSAFGESGEPT